MFHPILVPLLAVNLRALHEVTAALVIESFSRDAECVIAVDSDVDVVKPWRDNKEDCLRDHRVETQLLPDKPRVHCTGVGVSGNAVRRIVEAVSERLLAGED